jgi:5-methyltetrahydrofolate--homocysteine methyltransferase
MNDLIKKVQSTVVDLDIDSIRKVVQECLDNGISAWEIIANGLGIGIREVGEKFQAGEYYLADLVLSGELMKEGMSILEDKIGQGDMGKKGKVIMATVKGDLHDIGKNIVATMLTAAGFEVVDLGIDVDEKTIVDAVTETGAGAIGLSTLLTTTVESIRDVVRALTDAGLRDSVSIAIGGACTNEKLAREMKVNAYGEDAVQAVKLFEEFLS